MKVSPELFRCYVLSVMRFSEASRTTLSACVEGCQESCKRCLIAELDTLPQCDSQLTAEQLDDHYGLR